MANFQRMYDAAAKEIGKVIRLLTRCNKSWYCGNCGAEDDSFHVLLWDHDGEPRCPECCSVEVEYRPRTKSTPNRKED